MKRFRCDLENTGDKNLIAIFLRANSAIEAGAMVRTMYGAGVQVKIKVDKE